MTGHLDFKLRGDVQRALAPAHALLRALHEQVVLQTFAQALCRDLAHGLARNGLFALGDADARLGDFGAKVAQQRLRHGNVR